MLKILLVTPSRDELAAFCTALSVESKVSVDWAQSGEEALRLAGAKRPHLVVIDQALPDTAPLDLVSRLLAVDAKMNTAVVSAATDEEFHELSEGLGVMTRLPPRPGPKEAQEVLGSLRNLVGR